MAILLIPPALFCSLVANVRIAFFNFSTYSSVWTKKMIMQIYVSFEVRYYYGEEINKIVVTFHCTDIIQNRERSVTSFSKLYRQQCTYVDY